MTFRLATRRLPVRDHDAVAQLRQGYRSNGGPCHRDPLWDFDGLETPRGGGGDGIVRQYDVDSDGNPYSPHEPGHSCE